MLVLLLLLGPAPAIAASPSVVSGGSPVGDAAGASGQAPVAGTARPTSPAEAPRTAWSRMGERGRAQALAAVADAPIETRLVALSAHFLGARYVRSPLGEGQGRDPDPLFQSDAVDCLTFVEQSLALAHSETPSHVLPELNRLRYTDAGIGYANRLHLMEAQWLPTQIDRGFLRDITAELGGDATLRVQQELTALTWASRSSRALALPAAQRPEGVFPFAMLPLEFARERLDTFPNGSILLVIREARPLMATRITHLGIVVRRKGRTFLRHASRSGPGKVVDEDLATFLTRNAGYRKWPVVGVALLAPLERAAPRMAVSGAPTGSGEGPSTLAAERGAP